MNPILDSQMKLSSIENHLKNHHFQLYNCGTQHRIVVDLKVKIVTMFVR